jgi:hypothetical protein
MIYQALGALVAAIVIAVSSFVFGVKYESGQNAKKQQSSIVKAIEDTRREMKIQESIAVKNAERAAEKRYMAQGVKRELAKLPNRAECDWNSDEQRLLNDYYRTYFNAGANTSGLQDKVRQPTASGKPTFTLGTSDGGVGFRVQVPTR